MICLREKQIFQRKFSDYKYKSDRFLAQKSFCNVHCRQYGKICSSSRHGYVFRVGREASQQQAWRQACNNRRFVGQECCIELQLWGPEIWCQFGYADENGQEPLSRCDNNQGRYGGLQQLFAHCDGYNCRTISSLWESVNRRALYWSDGYGPFLRMLQMVARAEAVYNKGDGSPYIYRAFSKQDRIEDRGRRSKAQRWKGGDKGKG